MKKKKFTIFLLGIVLSIPFSAISQTVETFTTSGSWVCPAGVTSVAVECWGGGGGGGSSNSAAANRAGGGGGGGGYSKSVSVAVTPGNSYNIVVGSGGLAGSAGAGGAGTSSTFNGATVVAKGGSGGGRGGNGTSGAGATLGTGGTTFTGGAGAAGVNATGSGGGGGGAGTTGNGGVASGITAGIGKTIGGGNGGTGVNSTTSGKAGSTYGGGGSGGWQIGSSEQNGGAGASGLVKITYTCPTYSLSSTSGSSPVTAGSSSTVTLTSSAAGLPVGTYTVTYNLSAPNAATGLTATMTVGTAGSGSFITSSLTNTGSTTVTITSLSLGACSNAIASNNTSVIVVTYCSPAPSSVDGSGITNVTCGTINNTTGTETNNYGNYSAQSTSISQGATSTVNITYSTGYTYDTKIWVDWNNDSDFNDAGEEVYSGTSLSANPTTLAASFTVPVGASLGNHRMRIGGIDSGTLDPCYTSSYGTFEDYTLTVTAATPMAFGSCTTTQLNTSSVAPGATSQEIIGMQIVTTGVTSPLTASLFTFDITGSSAAGNIANAKLWTSGTASAFATTTPLGSATVSPAGSFTITGGVNMPYTLSSGTNYFWLTYDIVATPTLSDVVDATCTSITISSARTPTVTAPTGSRTILLNYCAPTYSSGGSSDNISHVVLETLDDNPPANNSPYYFDRIASQNDIPILNIGQTHTLSVTVGTDGTQYIRAWIDFNQDGDFDDAGESFDGGNPGASGTANIAMAIPGGAISGQTRMRIRGGDDCSIGSGQSCGVSGSNFGQAVDYYVNIAAAVNMSYTSCAATQLNTNIISAGTTNQEIICMKVVTAGSLSPLSATEFRMRTDGTTAYSTDIRNARVWYTGNSATFAASNQFGATVATPPTSGTDMVFTGTQTLSPGTNYFWMTYDVSSAAVNGNFADAKFQSVVIASTTQTPTISTPVEKREIIRGCFYTLTLKDDACDGWNGGKMTVKVNGTARLTDVTFTSGCSTTFQFIAESGQTITTEYTAGSYPSENSYFITNPNGSYVTSSGEAQTVPANKTATADCNAVKQFTTNVDSYQSGTSCFVITEDKTSQKGSIWSNYKINMTQSFTIEFDLYLGDDNGGADGVVFALQGSCTSAGGNGMSIGYGGINNSIGVEFDSYDNGDNSDLSSDHFAIISNGSADHGLSSNLRGPSAVADLEDNAWHPVKIIWNATTKKFSVSYGTLTTDTLSYSADIVTDLFAGNPQVFWGFTGATGALSNLQQVCITSYPQNTTQVADTTINAGDSVAVQVAIGAANYTWIPDDGSVSNTTIANPVLSPAVTTEYTCLLEDGCGKIITNKFTVRVNSTLPVELVDFSGICTSDEIALKWLTASESNNDYFILEKSTDMMTYQQIAIIPGVGNSTTVNSYSYLDKQNNGMSYYRLTQVDYDGKKTVFKPIANDCHISESLGAIIIYPNPAMEWFSLGLPTGVKAEIQIFNMMGMVVSEIDEITSTSKIEIRNLAEGVYIVKVRIGNEIYYCKLNKH
jgi:hypothetical protein